jgi:hypothetical protein
MVFGASSIIFETRKSRKGAKATKPETPLCCRSRADVLLLHRHSQGPDMSSLAGGGTSAPQRNPRLNPAYDGWFLARSVVRMNFGR